MTPAGFDTRRRLLGLTVDETAALCGAPEIAVERWQQGLSPIPDDAIDALDRLEMKMVHAAARITKRASTLTRPDPLILPRYRTPTEIAQSGWDLPLGAHAIVIAWAAQEMEADGIMTRIEWAEAAN